MKTPTQRFVEKAIEGGWNRWRMTGKVAGIAVDNHEAMFLDPEAWKAVGKVEGWAEEVCVGCGASNIKYCNDCAVVHTPFPQTMSGEEYMHHRFIDLLHEGKTIDEALESIIGEE